MNQIDNKVNDAPENKTSTMNAEQIPGSITLHRDELKELISISTQGNPKIETTQAKMSRSEDNMELLSTDEEGGRVTPPEEVTEEEPMKRNISVLINPDREPNPVWDIHDKSEAPLKKGELCFVTDDLDLNSDEILDADIIILPDREESEENISIVEEEAKTQSPMSATSWNISLSPSMKSTQIVIERPQIIKEIRTLRTSFERVRIRNLLLQTVMANYYMNNNMENAILQPEDDEKSHLAMEKYVDKLLHCCERKRSFVTYKSAFEEYYKEKVAIRKEKRTVLDDEINRMTTREKAVATGLLSSRTGNVLPDKVIDRLIKRQYQSMRTLTQWRIKFLKIRDRVNIMDAKVKDIECIGDGLRLTDYEDMMLESNNSMEKIEEKEEELLNLRRRCNEATQMLAHMREKQFAVEGDIVTGKKTVETLKMEVSDLRVRITEYRKEKVKFRAAIEKIKERNALLFKKPLLCDFAACVDREASMRAELQALKQAFEEGRTKLLQLRTTLTTRKERSSGKSTIKEKSSANVHN